MAADTATVTVLFTDLVGSTDLLGRVGEEAAEQLRREHFGLLRQAVQETGGREVKNLGDGLMVVFDGAAAAVSCAVGMQQRIAARPDAAEALQIRVGIAVGEADVEDGDYFGLPVVEAARLCARAEGGEILITELVRMLARSRAKDPMERVGALELKGLPEAVEAHRVLWTPLPTKAGAVPVPTRVSSLVRGVFVGREAERNLLDDALKDAREGRRRGVLIGGEPGIGKTTLTASFACDAAQQGAWVLYGRCDEDLFVPYQPWAEALAHLVAHGPAEMTDAHLDEYGPVLRRLVPQLVRAGDAGAGVTEDGDAERQLLFGAVVDLLARASARAPVVLLLDDLHWADEPTVQLLRHVLVAAPALRLVLLGTFRDSEVGRRGALADALAALHREHGVDRIHLRGLGDDELLSLLERIAGHEMTEDGLALRNALLAETEGNPFFVTELLRHLSETGAIYQDSDQRWRTKLDLGASGLPVSIREVVGTRVGRLGEDTERVLTMASVIGRDFDLDLLARVVDVSEDQLLDLCDAAVDAAVLRATDVPDRYTFAHALIERSLYDELSTSRRARAHRAIAEAIEEQCAGDVGDRVGELANHWAQATRPQEQGKALEYARLAAERSLRQLAPAEAARWCTEALALLEPEQERAVEGIALRVTYGEALRDLGDGRHREILLRAAQDARAIGASQLVVAAAVANSRGIASGGFGLVDQERIAVLRAALDVVGAEPSVDRARVLALIASELQYEPGSADERLAYADEAIAIARRLDDPALLVDVIGRFAESWAMAENLERRRADSEEVAAIGDRLGDPVRRWWGHWCAFAPALEQGDWDALGRHLAVAEELVERLTVPFYRWQTASIRSMYHATTDLDRADAASAEVLAIGAELWPEDSLLLWASIALNTAWGRGRLDEYVSMVDDSVRDNPGLPVFRAVRAWCYAWAGRTDEARAFLDEGREDGFGTDRNQLMLLTLGLWSEAAWLTGDASSAARLVARLEPWKGALTSSHASVGQAVDHYCGLARLTMGDLDAAVGHFEDALRFYRRTGSALLPASTEAALAGALVARDAPGDRERARELAERARAVADENGWRYIARTAGAALASLA